MADDISMAGVLAYCDPFPLDTEAVQLPLHPLQEDALLLVRVLVGVNDVAVVAKKKV